MPRQDVLKLRFLGEIQIERGGAQRLALPQSKKTRALLAYLVVSGRSHRRERLCSLLWDVADDPRGALRWSLSKLRPLVDSPKRERIISDGDSVTFDSSDVWIDAVAAAQDFANVSRQPDAAQLKQIVSIFRGEFLEGLDLPDFDEFQAWCVAEREQYRLLHAKILSALIQSLANDSEQALLHARSLVQIDPLNESAHAQLVQLLVAAGRLKEAERQYEAGVRILNEAGTPISGALRSARQPARTIVPLVHSPESPPPQSIIDIQDPPRIVGRVQELALLRRVMEETETLRREHVALVAGEPGIGKTRLISEIISMARAKGATIIEGCAYEAESSRPYGPWVDALRKVPAITVGKTIGADLAPMLPEFGQDSTSQHTRDQMYGAVVELIAARAHSSGVVVLAFDDIQWCDDASAALLHYVVRSNRHRAVMVLLGARSGELPDNDSTLRVLRGFRRDGLIEQIDIGPLSADETQNLAEQINPVMKDLRVFEETAGNPLFTIEVARSGVFRQEDIPQSLVELVHDRIERLPPVAGDVLRWGAVFGSIFTPATLMELPGLEPNLLMTALEKLERHGLIRYTGSSQRRDAYTFASDLVRRVAYADISEPRRRMMHGRVAELLATLLEVNDSVATDVVQHSALAGDIALAARACVGAGRRCLKLFANAQAETFVKRGMRFAEQLEEPERTKLLIELTRVSVEARRPEELHQSAREVESLAERALDYGCMAHARLAFHLSSHLRWEDGDWSVAERDTLRAELISRSAGEKERVVALAEAARCLTMLERDLAHASSLLLEASQLAERMGGEAVAIPIAEGLLHQHGGRNVHAARSFLAALELARRDRDRANEFSALEHLVMMKVDEGEYAQAQPLAEELAAISEKLREGSEAPFARVLQELIAYGLGNSKPDALDRALERLSQCDAKGRQAFALTRAAQIDLRNGNRADAAAYARQGLEMAEKVNRQSEIALALAILSRAAPDDQNSEIYRRRLSDLKVAGFRGLSEHARSTIEALTRDLETKGGNDGDRARRAKLSRPN